MALAPQKIETLEDIEAALDIRVLRRMPLAQRASFLSRVDNKLLALRRSGAKVPDELILKSKRMKSKEAMLAAKKRREPEPEPEPKYEVVDKTLYNLRPGEATRSSSDRYHGLLVARDEDGFYATDGEKETGRYSWCGAIPEEEMIALVDEG